MPIYEFICQECEKNFEYFVLSQRDLKDVRCPVCGSPKTRKVLSSFHSGASSRMGASLSSGSTCGTSTGFR